MINEQVFYKIQSDKESAFVFKEAFLSNSFFTMSDASAYINNTAHANYISVISEDGLRQYYTERDKYLDAKTLTNDILSGNSFVFNYMQRYNKEIFFVSNIMSLLFDRYVTTNIYGGVSKASKSYDIHADSQYVLILQLTGYSEWCIFNEVWDGSPETVVMKSSDTLTECVRNVLGPGDALYIPYRKYHKCTPLSGRLSLSVSVDRSPRPNDYGDWYSISINEFTN